MPTISGILQHAGSRYGSIGALSPIPNIPICLYNTTTSVGMYVLTTSTGAYTFNNVPSGTYILCECGKSGLGSPSPGDFSSAQNISAPTPSDPPYSAIVTPIANTNTVDSLSPNTIKLTLAAANITNTLFTDSTILNTPISVPTGITLGPNLLTLADFGIWGTLPNGTVNNTCPPTYPYTNSMQSSLLQYGPSLGSGPGAGANAFTMANINTNLWFFESNHTTFDETSSFLLINGGDPNAIIFEETVTVNPNTYSLATAWLLMFTNYPRTCLIGFRALASDGTTQLFYGQTNDIRYGEWSQIGQIFNTRNNSKVTLQVLSMSNIGAGNDFVLDDVSLQNVNIINATSIVKAVDLETAGIGDILTYTSVITTSSKIKDIIFIDTIPNATTFVSGSVFINSTPQPTFNPHTGFSVPNMDGGSTTTITFKVTVVSLPDDYKVYNTSALSYSLDFIAGDIITNTIVSNTVVTSLLLLNVSSKKYVDKLVVRTGETLTYTIEIFNTGNVSINNSIFFDTLPQRTQFLPGTVIVNGASQPSSNPTPPNGVNLNTIKANETYTISFQVLITP